MYQAMLEHFGPSGWWPAPSPFEVAIGAILTQNTAWRNVEKAMDNLRAATGLVPDAIAALDDRALESLIRPAGFFRQKTIKIRHFLDFLAGRGGLGQGADDMALGCLRDMEPEPLRRALLDVSGIGPETADCIVLYAVERPSFVVDAYTRRIFSRHGLVPEDVGYDELRDFFMDALPPDVAVYNEYHALIVRTGKDYCRKAAPRCGQCPLGRFLDHEPD